MKRRYITLDAMRGIAALAVVCLHEQSHHLLPGLSFRKGYLAVDFFFILSGFVLANAYDARLQQGLGALGFIRQRIIRLYPLYLLGTLISIALVLVDLRFGNMRVAPLPLAGAIITGLLMLPNPTPIEPQHWLLPFNIAGWSLLFEIAVNALYAATVRWQTSRAVIAVIAVSAIVLCAQTLAHGSVDVGSAWSNFALGIARTLFSFSMGVMLIRLRHPPPRVKIAAIGLPLLLIPTFIMGEELGPLFELACVIAIYPTLIMIGSRLEPVSAQPFEFLGLISFAIYALHGPMLSVQDVVLRKLGYANGAAPWWMGLVSIVGLVLFAWGCNAFYDAPLRKWITQAFVQRRPAAS